MVTDIFDPLLRDADAARVMNCSKATLWRRVADGTIPRPVKIGGMSRFPQSEILAVIECAKMKRTAGANPNMIKSEAGSHSWNRKAPGVIDGVGTENKTLKHFRSRPKSPAPVPENSPKCE